MDLRKKLYGIFVQSYLGVFFLMVLFSFLFSQLMMPPPDNLSNKLVDRFPPRVFFVILSQIKQYEVDWAFLKKIEIETLENRALGVVFSGQAKTEFYINLFLDLLRRHESRIFPSLKIRSSYEHFKKESNSYFDFEIESEIDLNELQKLNHELEKPVAEKK